MSGPVVDVIRHAATWFESSPEGFGSLLELIGDARLVLIGEASHGTHEFYRTRAELTKARAVVWAHNSHLGDARATQMGEMGELNLGQLANDALGSGLPALGFGPKQGLKPRA